MKDQRSNPANRHSLKSRIQNGRALRNQVKTAVNGKQSALGGLGAISESAGRRGSPTHPLGSPKASQKVDEYTQNVQTVQSAQP